MRYEKLVKEMLSMQQRLNDETNGENWEQGFNKNGKLISWKRCIYMECAELIDSFAWKHWKNINALPDKQNIAIELVDIWHFIMSLVLEQNYANKKLSIEKLANHIRFSGEFNRFCLEPKELKESETYEILNDIEGIIHICSGFNIEILGLLSRYFSLCIKCGVNVDILFEIYIGKNVLNKFRQDNGYKEGTYKKIWNGKEDNEVMSEILSSGISDVDEIYNKLSSEYKKI